MAGRAGSAFLKGMKESLKFVTNTQGFDRLMTPVTCAIINLIRW